MSGTQVQRCRTKEISTLYLIVFPVPEQRTYDEGHKTKIAGQSSGGKVFEWL